MRAGGPWRIKRIKRMEVPVSSLIRLLILDFEVRIVHMLLMSWGGLTAEEDETARVGQTFKKKSSALWPRYLKQESIKQTYVRQTSYGIENVIVPCSSISNERYFLIAIVAPRGLVVVVGSKWKYHHHQTNGKKACIWEKDESRGLASREIIRPQ